MNLLRMIGVGALLHTKQLTRSPFEIATALIVPVVQATLAVYLFRAGGEPGRLLEAAVGAGLMGVWSSVLFGSGGAVQNQRWQGTLEMIMLAPRPPALVIFPITLATAVTGTYAMLATLLWGWLLYGIPLTFAHPLLFLVAVPGCILGLGMFGLLLAATFVLMRNANALANTLEYPIWLVSGMLVPLAVLPGWTGPIAAVLPTTWGARAVHEAASGGPVWPSLGICLAISLGCLVAGALMMTYVERRARAAATLALA
ncbi:ABC-2 type transport system permease protein [Micromonospora rhizosphaerae]|uniref:ABC-2 type transport system permease protein n=1 Tax=Micromonospora rhizosphaerae TaxID=568872 RepID=A0A1C6TB80_9ACTN|nr:ABC transporter permease [Micromonospora rhizosphaerae]SCL38735.1 ABC-2 type transport system permease protein [Micromonospora rhizosphaerae]